MLVPAEDVREFGDEGVVRLGFEGLKALHISLGGCVAREKLAKDP